MKKRPPLELEQLGEDPIAAFRAWYRDAIAQKVPMPDAMALATAMPGGVPSLRWVLLKGVDEGGFRFFTSYESRKAFELSENPQAALAFHWQPLGRQVRIEGAVTRLSAPENDAYWATRSLESRVAAIVSKQSLRAPGREAMNQAFDTALKATRGRPDGPLRPAHWGGYRLWAQVIEFWQGQPNRFHDRFRYERAVGGGWAASRLWP